jgi:hypothetical protein
LEPNLPLLLIVQTFGLAPYSSTHEARSEGLPELG